MSSPSSPLATTSPASGRQEKAAAVDDGPDDGRAMEWSDLAGAQPRLAGLGRERLLSRGVVLVATIRADGTPRLSPVEPYVLDGVLWLSMLWGSTKSADLRRDPRILVHSAITSRDGGQGEFKIRGRA